MSASKHTPLTPSSSSETLIDIPSDLDTLPHPPRDKLVTELYAEIVRERGKTEARTNQLVNAMQTRDEVQAEMTRYVHDARNWHAVLAFTKALAEESDPARNWAAVSSVIRALAEDGSRYEPRPH